MCLNAAGDSLAITDKGKTAAEMMVFARYVMFSEVYWHHAVRSATAMLQRAFYQLLDRLDLNALYRLTEQPMVDALMLASQGTTSHGLLQGLFGPRRQLYKRLEQFSLFQGPELYRLLARRPYAWLVDCASRLAEGLSAATGKPIPSDAVLIDAPPVKREIEIKIDVFYPKEDRYRPLSSVSPVVQTLAKEQFDDYVKRVRVFVAPEWSQEIRGVSQLPDLLHRAIEETDQSTRDT
jgi:HD superfamily phosphohydrolase